MKVLSLFSGIGAFEKALDNIGKKYKLVGFSEVDKYATKSYCVIHGIEESMNLGDITKVNEKELPKNIDLVTYGFPCQDISLAGKQKGLFNKDGTQTRSGLFFDALRIIKEAQPRIAIAENVKNLTGKKFSGQFKIVLDSLEEAGYINYWKVLNAKDYGVPQNRERVFIVSIRKDIDTGKFEFPESFGLTKKLKDVLETEVNEKYYLKPEQMKILLFKQTSCVCKGNSDIVQVAQMYPNSGNPQAGRIYDTEGISPSLDTCSGGNRMPKICVKEATKKGYAEAYEGDSINLEQPNSKTRRGRVGKQVAQTLTTSCNQAVAINEPMICSSRGRNPENPSSRVAGEPTKQRIEINKKELSNTITTEQKDNYVLEPTLRIRKLTPKECFRLMGFSDSDFKKAEAVNSNTQLYKQAGNSIVVDVLMYIFNQIYKAGLLEE